jgi:hypothetical protein
MGRTHVMRPALPSALPQCQLLERCRTHIEAQTPKLSHFWLSVVNRGLPILVFPPRMKKLRLKEDFSPVHAPALPNRGRTLHLSRK